MEGVPYLEISRCQSTLTTLRLLRPGQGTGANGRAARQLHLLQISPTKFSEILFTVLTHSKLSCLRNA